MVTFLLLYFLIYGSMNAYAFLRVRAGLRLTGIPALVVATLFLLMVLLPLLVRLVERIEWISLARALATTGYFWMALVLWFCSLGIVMELWNLLLRGLQRAGLTAEAMLIAPHGFILFAGIALALLVIAAWHGNKPLPLETVELRLDRIAAGTPPLKILQISDLHLGLTASVAYAEEVSQVAERTKPDLIVSTGDFADDPDEYLKPVAAHLARATAPLGKFAVFGNHEWYAGEGTSLAFLKLCGFKVLRSESVTLSHHGFRFCLAGVDDPAGKDMHRQPHSAEAGLFPATTNREFTILLKHQPLIDPHSSGKFDLQLSGHTHAGQIYPFCLAGRVRYPYYRGLYALADGAYLYVSRGTGSWGPPLRLLAPREITLFVLQPKT